MSSQDPYSHPGPAHPYQDSSEEDGKPPEREITSSVRGPWIRKPCPFVTFILVFSMLGLHILQGVLGDSASHWVTSFGQHRERIWEGELWRLLTCSFFHLGWMHLTCNLLGIFLFGKAVERWLGSWRFLGCYTGFTLMGSLTYQAVSLGGLGVGASGALCGLLGIFLALRMGRKEEDHLVLGRRFFLWFSLVCCFLFLESFLWESRMGLEIADSAHFGGLFSGVLAALYFFSRPRDDAAGVTGRRGFILFTAGSLSLCLAVYGLVYPFMDWSWHLWRANTALEQGDEAAAAAFRARARSLGGDKAALNIIASDASEGRLGEALQYWKGEPITDFELRAAAGFSIYDGIYFKYGYCEEIEFLLDELIELIDRALEEKGKSLSLLNQAAWYRALRGKDLDRALAYAQEAHELDCRNRAVLNTLGWVYLRRAETREAFEYLIYSVSDPRGLDELCDDDAGGFDLRSFLGLGSTANYAATPLYLALAYAQIGQLEKARSMAARVRPDMLLLHEKKQLLELEETLGSSPPGQPGGLERRPGSLRR